MHPRPIRLRPGVDLRRELERMVLEKEIAAGFIISGIGSIDSAAIRYADDSAETVLPGPHEILSLAGSISRDGAHLHASLSDAAGRVFGGHVCAGNLIRTTAEILLLELPEWELSREMDAATGYKELVARPLGQRS